MRKASAAGAALVAAGAVLLLILRSDPPARRTEFNPPPQGSPSTPHVPRMIVTADKLGEALAVALQKEGAAAPSLAAEMRYLARTDPAYLARLVALILDESSPARARELAAFVLGTLPDSAAREGLSKALVAARGPAWARVLLLSLACDRTSDEDDDIFDLPDSPRVLSVPAGVSVRIGGAVDEPEIRGRMVPHLRSPAEAGVRWAASLALADSARFPEVRAAYLESVREERDPAAQGEMSKALADWAAGEKAESGDRLRVFTAILEMADRPDAAALRLRSEEGMKRMAWTSPEVRLMAGRIESGTPDQKRWAIAVLAGAVARPDLPDRSVILESFANACSSATEAKVREYAVSGLTAFPQDARARDLMLSSLRDSAWHVRAAAVRGLGRMARAPEIAAAVERIERDDPDERVRRAAGEVRRTLGN